jgi:hypothetical protein
MLRQDYYPFTEKAKSRVKQMKLYHSDIYEAVVFLEILRRTYRNSGLLPKNCRSKEEIHNIYEKSILDSFFITVRNT